MKKLKSLLSLFLCIVILITSVSAVSVSAETAETDNDIEVYYSDLFFGYEYYLKNATVLTDYQTNTSNILWRIYSDFLDSSSYDMSFWKEAINKGTSFKDLSKIFCDALGLTDFTYNEMLDGANELFVKQMLNGEGADAGYEACSDVAKVLKDLHGILNGIEDKYDPATMTDSVFFSNVIDTLKEAKFLSRVPDEALTSIVEEVHKGFATGATFVNVGASVIEFSKAFAVAISMENLRAELVFEIYLAAPSGSVLKDGMGRLYNQLGADFDNYFIGNYLVPEVLSDIIENVVSKLTESLIGEAGGLLGVSLGVIKLLNMVVFDVIFDTPDLCDLTNQEVLNVYATDLYNCLQSTKFDDLKLVYDNAKKFERLFVAYKASVNAAIDNCNKIALDSNKALLERLKDIYYDADIYTAIINQAKETIRNTPEEELVVTNYSPDIDIVSRKQVIFKSNGYFLSPTDEMLSNCGYEGNCIFTPVNGINAEIRIEGCRFVVPEGHKVYIDGQVQLFDDLNITPISYLIVYGELKAKSLSVYGVPYGDAIFENHGILRVGGVSISYAEAHFRQYDDAIMYLSGNFGVSKITESNIKMSGTVVYNGNNTTRQAISGGIAPTVILENEVWFRCPVKATKLFNHNGKYYILDSNDNVFVDYDGDGLRDDSDNYPTIPNDCHIVINCATPEYCSFISEGLQAVKGQKVYISAYPNEGYRLDKWVDSEGNIVSREDYFEITATKSETYTAIFKPILVGDYDNDGYLNAGDLVMLREHLLYWTYPAPWEVMDLNGDWDINILDLVRLKKLIANAA